MNDERRKWIARTCTSASIVIFQANVPKKLAIINVYSAKHERKRRCLISHQTLC